MKKKGHFVVDDSLGISLLTALSYKKDHGQYLLVASNLYKAQRIYNFLLNFLSRDEVLFFPNDELVRAEALTQSKELVAQRLYVLDQLVKGKGKVVVANLAGVTRYLPSPKLFSESCLKIKQGERYDINKLKLTLVKNGYQRVNKIDQTLQFASRGDILDIYSVNNDKPIRIEFFDDEVESIRYFDIASQTSIEKIEEVSILPASDVIFTDEEYKNAPNKIFDVLGKDQKEMNLGDFESLRNMTETDISDLMEGNITLRIYKYYSLIQDAHYSLFDYCRQFTPIFVDEDSLSEANLMLQNDSHTYLAELHEKNIFISHLEMYRSLPKVSPEDYITTSSLSTHMDDIVFDVRSVPFQASKQSDAINIIQNYLNDNYQIILLLSNYEQINVMQESFEQLGLPFQMVDGFTLPSSKKIGICLTTNVSGGFLLPDEKIAYLTSHELFNEKVHSARLDNRFKSATILRSFEDLEPGDYVVHEYEGIGQFVELQTLEIEGVHKDFLKIAYFGGEYLYVPLSQFQLVRKYLGKEGARPRLSHLHSSDWAKTKQKIKERINDLANRLMNLYIERSKVQGFAFPPDDEFQEKFENSFPYPLTPDQETAIKDIKNDMEKPSPMDRLLCGDVGFGKTEVAFQAAFKAINSGKQVAILCPTTLLVRQHYELAKQRFAGFDIEIVAFSRLIPLKEQKEAMSKLADGKAHLAIGTHRLLSKDVSFKDLGLLIIDEEQRFGVEQKEKLKELKTNIDVLTLSATPIPRTLQISLLGVRALSKIDTPPQDRMPIQTYVAPFKEELAKELIQRELGRNGQTFYLHNNISTVYLCANRLQKLLPGVSIGVAHGKMERNEIEDVMMRFYNGEIQVLVCTSIVENGIDVPNANMIIVEDSENYGLSQLYQIKGRVGRSNRIAYAYLFYSPQKILKEKAQQRLKALQEFTELGSGYRIAQRDLMIRGAGDILGPEQAGYIDSIGLDMYIKLLNEAVHEKMEGTSENETKEIDDVSLNIDAYIPSTFADSSDKIELYQEIAHAPNVEALSRIKIKTKDVFGSLPKEVDLLFRKRNIAFLKESAKVESLIDQKQSIEIKLGNDYINIRGIGNILFDSLIPYLSFIRVSYNKNVFTILIKKRNDWMVDLEEILKSLDNIQKTHKIKETVCA